MSVRRIIEDPTVDVDAIIANAAAIVAAAEKHKKAVVNEMDEVNKQNQANNRNLEIAKRLLNQRDADRLAPLREEYGQLDSVTKILDPKDDSSTAASSDDKEPAKDDTVKKDDDKKNDPPAADPSDTDDQPARGRFSAFWLLPIWMQLVIALLVFAFVTPVPWTGWAVSIMRFLTELPILAWIPNNGIADNIITFFGVVGLGLLLGWGLTKIANRILDARYNR